LSHDAYATANGLTYFLPTEDEWYKAAYYTGNSSDYWSLYANGSDTAPTVTFSADGTGWNYNHENTDLPWTVGSSAEEQNGTYDMMGNMWEWIETGTSARGGNFYTDEDTLASSYVMDRNPTDEFGTVSFRVVAVPEPATLSMLGIVSCIGFFIRRRFLV
jgi:formylglycine-generating enzyme required for sulfatase activity